MAMDSVMEDIEELTARATGDSPSRSRAAEPDDAESMRVDDLRPPPMVRAEYEVVVPERYVATVERCEGFELINFEDEADIIAFSG
jgi:hypothetical protein